MVLYIDVFFFYNFLCDFLILFSAGRFAGARFRPMRCAAGAAMGALYACAAAVAGGVMLSGAARLLTAAAMVAIAYGFSSPKRFFKDCLLFLLCSSGCAGGAYAVTYAFAPSGESSFLPYVLSFALSVFTAIISSSGVVSEKKEYVKISVIKDGKVFRFTALRDNGARCTDFVSGLPIIVTEDVFPEKIKENARTVTVNTAAGKGRLKVFVPDRVIFFQGKRSLLSASAAIGITDVKLSCDGRFNALVGGACFERTERKNTPLAFLPFGGR